jgi:ribulose-5-phosphate 4-epimerase/fuculose-1-phosphate aldolase
VRIANLIKMSKDFEWYHDNGYITARDGNACVRDGENFLVTASGVAKHELGVQTYVIVDRFGKVVESPVEGNKPSIETMAHIDALTYTAYEASVHVHSPNTVALFMLASDSASESFPKYLNTKWPELFRYTKVAPTVPFLNPGSQKLHTAMIDSFVTGTANNMDMPDIVVMQRHGVLAVGKNLEHCREHIHRLEHVSTILLKILSAKNTSFKEFL